jgi:hypothetical protein
LLGAKSLADETKAARPTAPELEAFFLLPDVAKGGMSNRHATHHCDCVLASSSQ